LPIAGPYQLRVKPNVYNDNGAQSITNGTGTYSVTPFTIPADVNGGTLTIGGAQKTAILATPGQDAFFSVTATTAGQKIKFTVDQTQMNPSFNPCANLIVSNGGAPERTFFCGPSYTSGPITLPTTGVYTLTYAPSLEVTPATTGTGTMKINITASP